MTETQYTGKLLRNIKEVRPGVCILKHSDRFTTGVPDFSITYQGQTLWFEAKLATNWPPTLLQRNCISALARQGAGAYYLVYYGGNTYGVQSGEFKCDTVPEPLFDFEAIINLIDRGKL